MESEKRKLHRKSFYQKNRKRLLLIQKEYGEANAKNIREYQRAYYRYKCYGLSKEQFDGMLESQNNKCKICETQFDLNDKKLSPHVDHDHSTGRVRALLCMRCNCGIGSFNENTVLLENAISYLRWQKSLVS